MPETFPEFAVKLGQFSKALSDPELKSTLMTDIGKQLIKIADAAASADLGGNPKFSGWRPTLDTVFDHIGPGAISFHPTKMSAGPWTVAEGGRNQGNASGVSGPGISQKTGLTSRTKSGGLRKVQARQSRRWNGPTAGKGTATKAVAKFDAVVTSLTEAYIDKAIGRVD